MKKALSGVLLVLGSLAVAFLLLELALRFVDGKPVFAWRNWIGHEFVEHDQQGFSVYDPVLGWSLAPNMSSSMMSTLEYGIRANGAGDTVEPGGILAVGDSFTAGSEVDDAETWPAYVEDLLGVNVNNAGVGAYGTDQAILRGEQLLDAVEPEFVLLGIFDQDILRTAYSVYGSAKPFFEVENGRAVARNTPVPLPAETITEERRPLLTALGHSYVADRIMAMTAPQVRLPHSFIRQDVDEVDVTCALLRRFRDRLWARGIPLAVVMQYGGQVHVRGEERAGHARLVIECIEDLEIPLIDEFDTIRSITEQGLDRLQRLYVMHQDNTVYGHMSAEGNRLVAGLIADALTPMPEVPENPAIPIGTAAAVAGTQRFVGDPQELFAFDFTQRGFPLTPGEAAVVDLSEEESWWSEARWQRLEATGGAGEHYVTLGRWDMPAGHVQLELVASPDGTCNLRTQILDRHNQGVLTDFDLCTGQRNSFRLGAVTGLHSTYEELDDGWIRITSRVGLPAGEVRVLVQLRDETGATSFAPDGESVLLHSARMTVIAESGS